MDSQRRRAAQLQVSFLGLLALAPRGRCLPNMGVVTGVEVPTQSATLHQPKTLDRSKVAV